MDNQIKKGEEGGNGDNRKEDQDAMKESIKSEDKKNFTIES